MRGAESLKLAIMEITDPGERRLMDSPLWIRCLSWDRNGELRFGDRERIVSLLQGSDREAAPALDALRLCTPLSSAA